jgi:transcription antitermination factor NusG
VELVKMDLKPEQRVRVMAGPLMDHEGKIIEIKNKVAKVAIDSLGYILIADIDRGKLMSTNHTNY